MKKLMLILLPFIACAQTAPLPPGATSPPTNTTRAASTFTIGTKMTTAPKVAPSFTIVPGVLQFTNVAKVGTNFILRWQGGGTNAVQLQARALITDAWKDVGSPTTNTVATNSMTTPTAFYRLAIVQPNAPWTHGYGGTNSDAGVGVAVDTSGNTILAGYSSSGASSWGGAALTNSGGQDMVLAKFTASVAHLWSKRYGGPANEDVRAVAVDTNGNIYLAGAFYGGNTTLGSLTNAGQYDCFIAKFDQLGNLVWSKTFGGTGRDLFTGLAIDPFGNVVVIGNFQSQFPGLSFGGAPLLTHGQVNIVVAKYDTNGNHLWSENFPSTAGNVPNGIAIDQFGNIYIGGKFYGTINFGGGNMTAVPQNLQDAFLVKLDKNGGFIWQQDIGSTNADEITTIALDAVGDVFAGIFFYLNTNLGDGVRQPNPVGADDNIALAKYSGETGSLMWARIFSGNIGSYIGNVAGYQAIASDGENVWFTGFFYGSLTLGSTTLQSANNSYDIFTAKYSGGGTLLQVNGYGGTGSDLGNGLTIDATGRPIVTGLFSGTATVNGAVLNSVGSGDAFLMRSNP